MKDNWIQSPIIEVTSLIKDGTHGTHKDIPNGIPMLSAKDIVGGKVLIPDDARLIPEADFLQIHKSYKLQENDVVLTLVGTIGRVAILRDYSTKFTFQRSVGILRFNERVNSQYAYYYTSSERFLKDLIRSMNASAQGGVYLGELGKINISFPKNLSQQRKIAQILTTCDAVIEKTEAAIAKYQAMKQGLMQDLFTRGIDVNTGKLRPKYEEVKHLYKESELGWIPKDWEVKRLENMVSETILGSPLRGTGSVNISLLKMGNLDWGYLKLDKIEYLSINLLDEKLLLKHRDFLFNTRNTPDLVGKTAVWKNEIENATFDNNLLRMRFRDKYASPYICSYMSFGNGKNRLKSIVDGTTSVAAIYWKNLKNFKISMPSKIEQEEIISRLDTVDHKIQTEQSSLSKYQQLKTGLMQDLLSGKVEVKVKK